MAGIEVFPSYLLDKDKKDDVAVFLIAMPIQPMRKKELAIAWAQMVGAAIDREFIEKCLGGVIGGWQ